VDAAASTGGSPGGVAAELMAGGPVPGAGTDDRPGRHAPIAGGGAAGDVGERLPGGWFRAGAATRSLVPPEDRWVQGSECSGAPENLYTPLTPEGCLITFDQRWADGVDPETPLMVRAQALSNGEQTIVNAVMDTVGYMAAYPLDICDRCGLTQIREDLAAELGIPAEHMAIQSTHTHAAPTTIAAGPEWYYHHIRDQVKDAIREAVAAMDDNPPARLQTGYVRARSYNIDRRVVDRAVPDDELTWLRAVDPASGQTIWSYGNYAVHPTVRGNNERLSSGLIGPFTDRLAAELGGIGMWSPGALGDQREDFGYGIYGMGYGMADLIIGDLERGTWLESNDIEVVATTVQLPVENNFFAAALAAGYAVRDILPPYGGGPLAVAPKRNRANVPMCEGGGAVHVVSPVSAWRIGERPAPGKVEIGPEHALPVPTDNVVFVHSPGEMFASMGLVIKDYASRSDNVFVQAITNDTVGYMAPSNQYDDRSTQGSGIAHNMFGTGNYEEALSLGRCTGDITSNAMIELITELGVLGESESR
jgi:hypothetical protein